MCSPSPAGRCSDAILVSYTRYSQDGGGGGAAPHPSRRGKPLTGACRARHCAETTFRLRGMIHTMALPGNPRGRAFRCVFPGSGAGRRSRDQRGRSPSSNHRATTMIRDAGPPQADQKAGAPGRDPNEHALPTRRRSLQPTSSRRGLEGSIHHLETLPTSLYELVGTARLSRGLVRSQRQITLSF